MSYIDLVSKLSNEDKQRITNYITTWGIQEKDFIGIDKYLEQWSHAKQKLYKLLGNQFIVKVPYNLKTLGVVDPDFSEFVYEKNNFRNDFINFCEKVVLNTCESSVYYSMVDLVTVTFLTKNTVPYNIKYKKPQGKKTLQIQKGEKILKAIQKVMLYFKDDYNWDEASFEEFRVAHAKMVNNKKIEGELCISIHPLDFITMSDNNSNWQSCMTWVDGCYRIGTVEMMNSNNVLCCYIHRPNNSFCFTRGEEPVATDDPLWNWNNKNWRVLCYTMKDLLMIGKAYPFTNKDISIDILNIIKDYAKKNLNWTYSFGPELYQDMKYVHSEYPIDRSRSYICANMTTKHNIMLTTNGMYNDILNDHREYWCYRNKVAYNKVISVSGKAICLKCGQNSLTPAFSPDSYNDRYSNTEDLICASCKDGYYCDSCGQTRPNIKHYKIKIKNNITGHVRNRTFCENCYKRYFKICPDCGKVIALTSDDERILGIKHLSEETLDKLNHPIKTREFRNIIFPSREGTDPLYDLPTCIGICGECAIKNHINNFKLISTYWSIPADCCWDRLVYVGSDVEKYLVRNLNSSNDIIITEANDSFDIEDYKKYLEEKKSS